MACKSLFVTATGTDVGKTYISALIVKSMRDAGFNCGYFKPVLSGATNGVLGDCNHVLSTSGLNIEPKKCVSYSFEEPVSPHLAAFRSGVEISLDKILEDFSNFSKDFDYMVVEGAGGITCPFSLDNNRLLLPDVIKSLANNVLIVADAGLGTINSTLLTSEYARLNGIKVSGIVLNNFDRADFMHQDNLTQIEQLTGYNVVATVEKDAKYIKISENELEGLFK